MTEELAVDMGGAIGTTSIFSSLVSLIPEIYLSVMSNTLVSMKMVSEQDEIEKIVKNCCDRTASSCALFFPQRSTRARDFYNLVR